MYRDYDSLFFVQLEDHGSRPPKPLPDPQSPLPFLPSPEEPPHT